MTRQRTVYIVDRDYDPVTCEEMTFSEPAVLVAPNMLAATRADGLALYIFGEAIESDATYIDESMAVKVFTIKGAIEYVRG
ncbi:hypothetical protein [Bacillus sp. FJAT-52991]|uniref:Uncharacterized protein n=1 Tax=Bacillus kandeliae TaxID=3129297 RepID=A0ABZ2N8K6_9BACI